MRNKILFVVFILPLILACSKKEKAIIQGKIENAPSGEIAYLQELLVSGDHMIDSMDLRYSGKFRFAIPLKEPGFYQLVFSSGPAISMIISPGEKIQLSAVMNNFYATKSIIGSENTIRLNRLHDSLRATVAILDELRDQFFSSDSTISESAKDSIARQYLNKKEVYHHYSTAFILEDLKSLANIGALYQEYGNNEYVFNSARDIQFFKLVSDTLSKYYPKVRYVKTLRENYQVLYNEYQTQRLLQSADHVTHDIPELTLPGKSGKPISLSSLKGRLVLLSFWSVQQEESVENTIALKKVYNKFHSYGFEIYQVGFDKSVVRWKKAIQFEEIPWISVLDTAYPGSKTQYLYNVNSLPMNYLLDKEQKEILAKNITPEELERSLPLLINKKR